MSRTLTCQTCGREVMAWNQAAHDCAGRLAHQPAPGAPVPTMQARELIEGAGEDITCVYVHPSKETWARVHAASLGQWCDIHGRYWRWAPELHADAPAPSDGLISAWMPEPDAIVHQVIGKLAEEANEVAGRAVRVLIQGLDGTDPQTRQPNWYELRKELADIKACIATAEQVIGAPLATGPDMAERQQTKVRGYLRWHQMIRNILAGRPPREGLDE